MQRCARSAAGHSVCIVSSGAVGMGCQVLRLSERPAALATRQALAAIGQGALMRMYTDFFAALSMVRSTSQVPPYSARHCVPVHRKLKGPETS